MTRDILTRLSASTRPRALAERPAALASTLRIEAKADTATVYLFDEIGGYGIWASELVPALAALDVGEIAVRINSPGGDFFDGVSIANALAEHPAKVVMHVDGLAASAASVIAMAGDEIVMHPGAQMMIHDALTMTYGNAGEHARSGALLDKVSQDIAALYAVRAGVGDQASWRAQMLAETWYTADEAVTARLADRAATRTPGVEPVEPPRWQNALAAFRASLGPVGTDVSTYGVPSASDDQDSAPADAVQPAARAAALPTLSELVCSALTKGQ